MTDRKKAPDHPLPFSAVAKTANEDVTSNPPLWLSRLELPLEPAAVHEARAHTRATLHDWGMAASVIDDAELIVSELATNAIRHSKPPESSGQFVLTLCRLPRALNLYVYDDDPQPPVMRAASDDDTDGRGLFLVGQLGDDWGYLFPRPDEGTGKAVMATLRLGPVEPGEKSAPWDAHPMPPVPDSNPWTNARIMTALREVIHGGPFIYA
jgi:anti-sigma regulatory factor (Ser/Thr protein kinase)